ncbi:GNAT family N-acetyltransferase [archaeon]|jgi:predicted GNAT family acetyltransferase|nr:GNAT family N-acetyltransferase [archaeon]MBT4352394.1 GNAT family N-acetyltransferase [archaeon]MBT4648323.1 GNAT family N-acetyltransferase [archaeon]MBT6822312.1 GNAT family N-acetyltransferase [archaeon]MBT7391793.1 GNAT family N-acetyltransferase [archaeon]
MLKLISINKSNWKTFQSKIIDSEKEFPKDIRAKRKDYLNVLSTKSCIFLAAMNDKKYVGTISGYKPTKIDMSEHRLKDYFHSNNFIYVYNYVVNRNYRGKGYGKILMKNLSQIALDKGYKTIVGHFRLNNSLNIINKVGNVRMLKYENWKNQRNGYLLCEVKLSRRAINKV